MRSGTDGMYSYVPSTRNCTLLPMGKRRPTSPIGPTSVVPEPYAGPYPIIDSSSPSGVPVHVERGGSLQKSRSLAAPPKLLKETPAPRMSANGLKLMLYSSRPRPDQTSTLLPSSCNTRLERGETKEP